MLGKFSSFLRYNNAVPVSISLLLLSVSGALAASPDLRSDLAEGIVTTQTNTLSIDNSYIVSVNLETYTPSIQITNVTEDDTSYYIDYTLGTIDLDGGAWRDVTKKKELVVAKEALHGKDLGLYATGQLAEVGSQELARLRETQKIEKGNGVTEQVVATTYSGLIGKFLDSKEEVLPGYTPVIPEPTPSESSPATEESSPTPAVSSSSGDTTPPGITILGNSLARIPINSTYVDLGVVILDNVSTNLEPSLVVDGVHVSSVSLDTRSAGEHTISYTAQDSAGNTATVTRTVTVYDPYAVPLDTSTATSTDTATTTAE